MNLDPNAAILALALTRHELESARPDAPVVPDTRIRPPRSTAIRLRAARALHGLAQRIEPTGSPRTCP
ncbi:hypothetical protein [Nocardioides sp.]|uniref:hypothetical protein n=1 Tax=Nocardioides sp. TaxID=35761 RepID=UPI002EDB5512